MFNVIVSFGDQSQWQFMFKDRKRAQEVNDNLVLALSIPNTPNSILSIDDDFGNKATIIVANITGLLIEDYSKSADASIERHMTQARAQAKAQSKVNADPMLRMVAPTMNGPMPPGMMRS